MDTFSNCQIKDGSCNAYNSTYKEAKTCVVFKSLDNDLGSLFSADVVVSEGDVIENRLGQKLDPALLICPKHRYSLGLKWKPKALCQYKNECMSKGLKVPWNVYTFVKAGNPKFVLGSLICKSCKSSIIKKMNESDDEELNTTSGFLPEGADFDDEEYHLRKERLDKLTTMLNVPTIPSQIKQNVSDISHRTRRYIQKVYADLQYQLTETFAYLIAPGQEEAIKKVITTIGSDEKDDTKELQNLKDAYSSCSDYRAKISVLTLVPATMSKLKVCEIFDCKEYEIRKARQIVKDHGACAIVEPEKRIYSRMSIDKAVHYVDFLFSSGLLQEQAFGSSKIKFSSGDIQRVSATILNGVYEHAIQEYLTYCKEVNYPHLGVSTLRKVLTSMKVKARQKIAGVDGFIVQGIESFDVIFLFLSTYIQFVRIDISKSKKKE